MSDASKAALQVGTGKRVTGIAWPYMRLSDALLLHAEASYRLGDMGSAMESLMRVRNRAFPTNPTAAANINPDFFLAIVEERAWELCGENIRKWDLIRWNLLGDYLERFKDEHVELARTGNLPTRIGGGKVPERLYFRYYIPAGFDYREIDYSSVNWRNEITEDTTGWIAAGIYNIRFFPFDETSFDLNRYLNLMDIYNAGYFKQHNNHLFAIPATDAHQSRIQNDPYWANIPPPRTRAEAGATRPETAN
jgi:hypothetical protein